MTTSAKKEKMNIDSSVNQGIKRKFVEREVKACFSYEMEAVLKQGMNGGNSDLPDYDQIENSYEERCPECGEAEESPEDQITEDKQYKCASCEKIFDEWEQEPQDIMEWWIVTKWLYEKLKAKNHPVLEWGNNYYWGRCTSGQAILLDGVISEICAEMKILEGQQNDWSKHK